MLWLGAGLALLAALALWPGVDASVSTFQIHITMNGSKQQNTVTAIRNQNVF
ncbi:MAG TPA: hypothetical protein VJ323_04795 [Bryobacteraceae bacterium]|nr:hypothetical protein [Bryobacteraceae bacterium]